MVNVLNQGAEQPTIKETVRSFCEEVCEETKRYFTGVADVCVGTAWSTYAVACVLFAKANNLVFKQTTFNGPRVVSLQGRSSKNTKGLLRNMSPVSNHCPCKRNS